MLSKKRKPFAVLLCISFMILMGLAGCSDDVNHEAAETTVLDTATIDTTTPTTISFDFSTFELSLPAEYALEPEEENSVSISYAGQPIAGIKITDLDVSCIQNPDSAEVSKYLDTYAPITHGLEYITMKGNGFAVINLKITDYETNASELFTHYLFERNSYCCDFWFNSETADADEVENLLRVLGIKSSES